MDQDLTYLRRGAWLCSVCQGSGATRRPSSSSSTCSGCWQTRASNRYTDSYRYVQCTYIVGYMYVYVDRAVAALAWGVGRQRLVTDTQIVTDMSIDG